MKVENKTRDLLVAGHEPMGCGSILTEADRKETDRIYLGHKRGLTDTMAESGHNTIPPNARRLGCVVVSPEANSAGKLRGDFEAMVRRRFQNPKPFKEGRFWWLRVWDTNPTGSRKRQRIKLARADMPAQEVKKIAEDKLRPVNQGLELTGSAMTLSNFLTSTYEPTFLPLLSNSTLDCYKGVISKYLKPRFGDACLRDLTRQTLQQYFSGMAAESHTPRSRRLGMACLRFFAPRSRLVI